MPLAKYVSLRVLAFMMPLVAWAQNATPLPVGTAHSVALSVVVTGSSKAPVSGLPQSAFTLLDNGKPQALTSFRAVDSKSEPVKVLIVVDAVNIGFSRLSYARDQIESFLQLNDGQLAQPTSLAIFTDTSTQALPGYTTDGNALGANLKKQTIGLRDLRRSSGFEGAEERLELSLRTLRALLAEQANVPGRKVILWVSPGWPLLSGPGVQLSSKESTGLFGEVVALSTQMRNAGVTLYAVDPLGAEQSPASIFYYQVFVKGARTPGDVAPGDLGLQVLAVQSGGLALSGSNDVRGLLQKAVDDTKNFYELSYTPPPSEAPGEYHRIEVQVAGPRVTARTRQGFYSE